ncbi:hypothetical protein D3C76_863590 [compost metagenome]
MIVIVLLRRQTPQHRDGGAHHVHGVGGGGQLLQGGPDPGGQAAQGLELGLVGGELGHIGQMAVHQQVGNLFKLAAGGHVQDVVATVVQIVAGEAHGAQGGVAGGGAGEGDGFLRLEAGGFGQGAHHMFPHSVR